MTAGVICKQNKEKTYGSCERSDDTTHDDYVLLKDKYVKNFADKIRKAYEQPFLQTNLFSKCHDPLSHNKNGFLRKIWRHLIFKTYTAHAHQRRQVDQRVNHYAKVDFFKDPDLNSSIQNCSLPITFER